jgi:anti-anti-sigma regulatory factor
LRQWLLKQAVSSFCKGVPSPDQLVLDLSQTTFIDSSGVGALVSNVKVARGQRSKIGTPERPSSSDGGFGDDGTGSGFDD